MLICLERVEENLIVITLCSTFSG